MIQIASMWSDHNMCQTIWAWVKRIPLGRPTHPPKQCKHGTNANSGSDHNVRPKIRTQSKCVHWDR